MVHTEYRIQYRVYLTQFLSPGFGLLLSGTKSRLTVEVDQSLRIGVIADVYGVNLDLGAQLLHDAEEVDQETCRAA